jgi:hypothetical protein
MRQLTTSFTHVCAQSAGPQQEKEIKTKEANGPASVWSQRVWTLSLFIFFVTKAQL